MTASNVVSRTVGWIVKLIVALAFVVGVVVLMLWLAGRFTAKVPDQPPGESAQAAKAAFHTAKAEFIARPLEESAVGTIRAVHETSIGSKLLARVVDVRLKAGERVKENDVLVRLDDTDLQAKLRQAEAAVAAARAVRDRAASDQRRYAELVKKRTISQQQYDEVVASLHTAEAELNRAKATQHEVQATLDWATIRAPFDAVVIDKKVDVGDMVVPGQLLVTLFDPERMQLVASVRESLTHKLQVGQKIPVQVDALKRQCEGKISEIVPESQSTSRSFQVKVTGPCPSGVYSGMFGRILIPLGDEQVLVIPRAAVRNVGQLQLVEVLEGQQPVRRAIRVGRTFGEQVEVLSGLREGERVVVPETGGIEGITH